MVVTSRRRWATAIEFCPMNEAPRSSRLAKSPVPLSRGNLLASWPKVAGKSSSSRTGFLISLGLHGCLAAAACSLVLLPADDNGSGGVSVEGEASEMVMGLVPAATESSETSSTNTPAPHAMPMPIVQVPVLTNNFDLPPPERWTVNVPAATPRPIPSTVAATRPASDRTGTSQNPRRSSGGNSAGKGSSNGSSQGGGGNSIAQKQLPSGPPQLISAPPPRYPAAAKSAGKSGQVRVLVQVRGNGSAAATSLYHSSGNDALDNAAVAAARSWKFTATPSLGNGQTFPVVVKVNFRL